jgi:membrane-associated phospholipid phosphatase
MVIGALLFEKAIFLPATFAADRDRPPVGQLDGHPPSSSFFSGHVAAAVALYFGVFAVVCWHTRSRIARTAMAVFATIVVVCVALSRLLLGMHYASDVVTGALVGMIAVLLAHHVLTNNLARRDDERAERRPRLSC